MAEVYWIHFFIEKNALQKSENTKMLRKSPASNAGHAIFKSAEFS